MSGPNGPGDVYQTHGKQLGFVMRWAHGHGPGRWRRVRHWAQRRLNHAQPADRRRWAKVRHQARLNQLHARKHKQHHADGPNVMYDSVDVFGVPKGADAVAGYKDGVFENFSQMKAMFPNARALGITVFGMPNAHAADFEPGDLAPDKAVLWYNAAKHHVKRPVFYGSKSWLAAVWANLNAAGVRRADVRLWDADPTGVAHRTKAGDWVGLPECDATQHTWTDHYDKSLLRPDFWD